MLSKSSQSNCSVISGLVLALEGCCLCSSKNKNERSKRLQQSNAKPPFVFLKTLLNILKGSDTDEAKFMIQVCKEAGEEKTLLKRRWVPLAFWMSPQPPAPSTHGGVVRCCVWRCRNLFQRSMSQMGSCKHVDKDARHQCSAVQSLVKTTGAPKAHTVPSSLRAK